MPSIRRMPMRTVNNVSNKFNGFDLSEKYSHVDQKLEQYYYKYYIDCNNNIVDGNQSDIFIDLSSYRAHKFTEDDANVFLEIDEKNKKITRHIFKSHFEDQKYKNIMNHVFNELKCSYNCSTCGCFVGVKHIKNRYCSFICYRNKK